MAKPNYQYEKRAKELAKKKKKEEKLRRKQENAQRGGAVEEFDEFGHPIAPAEDAGEGAAEAGEASQPA